MITHLSQNSSKTASIEYQLQNNYQLLKDPISLKNDHSPLDSIIHSRIINLKPQ